MGYIKHHAIVVTDWYESIPESHNEAKKIFGEMVSPIVMGTTNGQASFFIPPDGSKEGWEDSKAGDVKRDAFVAYCIKNEVEFVEVMFGGDDDIEGITRSSWRVTEDR